jgi:hypothetical protein
MYSRLRIVAAAAAAVIAIAAIGCATMAVSSHVARGVDFAQFRVYDWGPADALPTGDPRLDNNEFFHDYLRGAVERQMATRGYKLADTEPVDLLLHYHANVSQRIFVNEYSYDEEYPRAFEYEEGTIVLDVMDARTNRLLWRGWAQDSIEGFIDDQERLRRKVTDAVTKMMAEFPHRPAAGREKVSNCGGYSPPGPAAGRGRPPGQPLQKEALTGLARRLHSPAAVDEAKEQHMDAELYRETSIDRQAADIWSDGVQIDECDPLQHFVIQTRNTTYELISLGKKGEIMVRGGRYFPELTHAWLTGASACGPLKLCGIYVGTRMELRIGTRTIVTSTVVSISELPAGSDASN